MGAGLGARIKPNNNPIQAEHSPRPPVSSCFYMYLIFLRIKNFPKKGVTKIFIHLFSKIDQNGTKNNFSTNMLKGLTFLIHPSIRFNQNYTFAIIFCFYIVTLSPAKYLAKIFKSLVWRKVNWIRIWRISFFLQFVQLNRCS